MPAVPLLGFLLAYTAPLPRCRPLSMCEPPISPDALDDNWRAVRQALIAGNGEVVPPAAEPPTSSPTPDWTEEGWVHRIAAPEKGCLLVSQPDVYFGPGNGLLRQSVLLLLEHDDELGGSLAIALNRPTDNELGDVLSQPALRHAFGERPLHLGGTESESGKSNVFMLCETEGATREQHRASTGDDSAAFLLPGLWLASAAPAAGRILEKKGIGQKTPKEEQSRFHFYAGATVWDRGRLKSECDAGCWYTLAASTQTIKKFLLGDEEGKTPEFKYETALGWAKEELEKAGSPPMAFDVTGGDGDDEKGEGDGPKMGGWIMTSEGPTRRGAAANKSAKGSGDSEKRRKRKVAIAEVLAATHAWLSLLHEEEVKGAPDGKVLTAPSLDGALGVAHGLLHHNPDEDEDEEDEEGSVDDMIEIEGLTVDGMQLLTSPSKEGGIMNGIPISEVFAAIQAIGEQEEGDEEEDDDDEHDEGEDAATAWLSDTTKNVERIADRCRELLDIDSSDGHEDGSGKKHHGMKSLTQKLLQRYGHVRDKARKIASRRTVAPAPRFALHAIRQVLLHELNGYVIPDEQPALPVDRLGLDGLLEGLARRCDGRLEVKDVMDRAAAAAEETPQKPLPYPLNQLQQKAQDEKEGKPPRLEMSSLQLGLVIVLISRSLGLHATLVEVDGSGLLLRVDMGKGEDPLYSSLEPGEGCGRTIDQRDCVWNPPPPDYHQQAGRQRQGQVWQKDEEDHGKEDEDDEAPRSAALEGSATTDAQEDDGRFTGFGEGEYELQPLDIACLLVEEWCEAYRHAGDSSSAEFWEMQRHTLQKIMSRMGDEQQGGHGGVGGKGGLSPDLSNMKGVVVKVHRPPPDGLDFGI